MANDWYAFDRKVLDRPVRVGGTDRDAARMARHSEMNPMELSL